MHELGLLAIPALAAPVYALRAYIARRRARRLGAIDVGETIPDWGPLPSTDGRFWGTKDTTNAKATVFVFMSNRCPGVKAYDARLNALASAFRDQDVQFLGVNSVPDSLYPTESLQNMKDAARERGLSFPYAKDPDQGLMHALGAVCTPQAMVVDAQGRLQYRGRIDDAFIAERAETHELRDAIRAVVAGTRPTVGETHAIGCSIDEAPRRASPKARAASPLRAAVTGARA